MRNKRSKPRQPHSQEETEQLLPTTEGLSQAPTTRKQAERGVAGKEEEGRVEYTGGADVAALSGHVG